MPELNVHVTFPDLILRLADDAEERTFEGLIVPWGKPARVQRPIPGWESYRRGALDKSLGEARRPIPLLIRHSEAEPAAVIVEAENRDDGQWAKFRALRTRAGDDALELIREGLYTGLSIGGYAVPARTSIKRGVRGEQLIERAEIRLDHVGLVREPAFEEATVLRSADDFDEWDAAAVARARQRVRSRLGRMAIAHS